MKTRKSWQEKLADSKDLPRVVEITDKMSQRWGTGTLVIPAPVEVDEIMRKVPEGKITTIKSMRFPVRFSSAWMSWSSLYNGP